MKCFNQTDIKHTTKNYISIGVLWSPGLKPHRQCPGCVLQYLEVGQGASAGAPNSQTVTSTFRQTRAPSPALSQ